LRPITWTGNNNKEKTARGDGSVDSAAAEREKRISEKQSTKRDRSLSKFSGRHCVDGRGHRRLDTVTKEWEKIRDKHEDRRPVVTV